MDWVSVKEFRKELGACCVSDTWVPNAAMDAHCDVVILHDSSLLLSLSFGPLFPSVAWYAEAQREQGAPTLHKDLSNEHVVWRRLLLAADVLTNIRCRDCKLLLFLDHTFCCVITEQTILPIFLMKYMEIVIRGVVSSNCLRHPPEFELKAHQEFWRDEKRTCLEKATNLDCGTFVLHPAKKTFYSW